MNVSLSPFAPKKLVSRNGFKGRKGQHGVGLAIKEEIVIKAGEDGITFEFIRTRLLKA